jgi:hypothetical protein
MNESALDPFLKLLAEKEGSDLYFSTVTWAYSHHRRPDGICFPPPQLDCQST